MTKIDIFSGFLGAGKTTLIKKLISEAYVGEKLVLIENEFGEIGIDGGFMQEAGIEVNEMNSGCICCSLVGDFTKSLEEVLQRFSPDRILIEPSGVGKLSDVIKAVQKVESGNVKLNSFTTVVDASKCTVYSKNFGEFYNDQLEHAGCIILSRTDNISHDKLDRTMAVVREKNAKATVIATPWESLSGEQILDAMENRVSLNSEMEKLKEESCPVCGHHHHHHEHEHEHHHHHHHHGEDCCCHEHGEHDEHHHHHHHHADEVFDSWGVETTGQYTVSFIENALNSLEDSHRYGAVLRAKGIVAGADGDWIHFDYVPGEVNVRLGSADIIGKLCVIGSNLKQETLSELFAV